MPKAKQGEYDVKGFTGSVVLRNAMTMPDGRGYYNIAGKLSILSDEELLGFKVASPPDANWIVRVESIDGERSINVPGCQVASVLQGEFDTDSTWTFAI